MLALNAIPIGSVLMILLELKVVLPYHDRPNSAYSRRLGDRALYLANMCVITL